MSKRTRMNRPNPEKTQFVMRVCQPEPGQAMRLSDGSVYARGEDGALRRVGTATREKDRDAVEEMRRQIAAKAPAADDEGGGRDGIEAHA